jgi:hypothetical protein
MSVLLPGYDTRTALNPDPGARGLRDRPGVLSSVPDVAVFQDQIEWQIEWQMVLASACPALAGAGPGLCPGGSGVLPATTERSRGPW